MIFWKILNPWIGWEQTKRVSPVLYPAISTSLTLFDSKELNYLGNKLSTKFGNNWQGGKGKEIEKGSERKINTFPYVCLNEERKKEREQVENIISEFLITIVLQQEYNFKSISLYIGYEWTY